MAEKKAKEHTQVTSSTPAVDARHDTLVTSEQPAKVPAPITSPQEGHPEQAAVPAVQTVAAVPESVVPTPPPAITPPVTLDAPLHIVTDAPEPKKPNPTTKTVRCLIHLDDTNDTGKSYRPGHIIEGWAQEKVDRLIAAGQVEAIDT